MRTQVQIPMQPVATPARSLKPAPSATLLRRCACGGSGGAGGGCAECKKKRLQRSAAGRAPEFAPPIVHEVLGSAGHPLDGTSRSYFEPRFGHDFSKVRIHSDARASESAQPVNALAYTVGRHIAFASGLYQPRTASGQRLLAHELTHVVQQQSWSTPQSSLRIGPAADAQEHEAQRTALAMGQEELNSTQDAPESVQRQTASPEPPPAGSSSSGAATPKPENCPAPKDLACAPSKDPVKGATSDLVFLVDSADLDKARPSSSKFPTARAEIDATAESWKKAGASGTIRIDGYASAEYECVYNWHLSCRRAQAVADELRKQGVADSSLSLFAHGESDAAGAALAPNRRATISLPAGPKPTPTPTPKPTPPTGPTCGPDITSSLSAVLSSVDGYFKGLSWFEKRRSCGGLDVDSPFVLVNPIMAWDIRQLYLPNTYWLNPYYTLYGCGSPRDPACTINGLDECEIKGTCGNTVLVGGKCMLAGTANYAIYGKMFKLCHDEFSADFPRWDMKSMIWLWKKALDDPDPPTAMATAAFDGTFPTLPADAENRGNCTGRCSQAFSGSFDFVWEPYKPRGGSR